MELLSSIVFHIGVFGTVIPVYETEQPAFCCSVPDFAASFFQVSSGWYVRQDFLQRSGRGLDG